MMANFQEEAINKLGVTAPELISMILSFRDMSDELPEGSDTSVGVVVLKAGANIYFIPIVALGDTIYPIDSIFDTMDSRFKPLTKAYVSQIIAAQSAGISGKSVVMPKYVNKNPSIYNLIVPPRTGKYAYASAGLFSEFISSLPTNLKEGFSSSVLSNHEVVSKLNGMLNMAEFMDCMAHRNPVVPTETVAVPEVQIYTAADADKGALTDHIIQDILNVGYHIKGDNVTPRVAVETPRGSEGFSKLHGVEQGRAYEIVLRDGSTVKAMVPKSAKSVFSAELDKQVTDRGGVNVGLAVKNKPLHSAVENRILAVTEYGDWITQPEAVIRPNPLDISEVASELHALSKISTIYNVERGDYFLVITSKGYVGPFHADNVSATSTMVTIRACSETSYDTVNIIASSAFKGDLFCDAENIYLPAHASVVELGRCIDCDVELSLTSAMNKEELKTLGLLESQMVIRGHDNGFFSINGRELGNEAELAKALIISQGIAKQAALGFIKSAKEKKVVTIYLSKKASDMGAVTPGDIPEYGQSPTPESGELFDRGAIEQATATLDPGVVESTIISQFLQDPSMIDTISSYLPAIKNSIDKIGRSLLLLRINSGADVPDDVSNLITSLRNTYKMLGDNCIKLEFMINGSLATNT